MSVTPKTDKKFRAHDVRFKLETVRRATKAELSQMRCTACHNRPQVGLGDYELSQGSQHWCMVCACKGKYQWFRVIDA